MSIVFTPAFSCHSRRNHPASSFPIDPMNPVSIPSIARPWMVFAADPPDDIHVRLRPAVADLIIFRFFLIHKLHASFRRPNFQVSDHRDHCHYIDESIAYPEDFFHYK
jgi:hypothetical protein